MVFQLSDDPYTFPDPHYGEDDGLVAVGGDLSVDRLITAYSNGFFPWYGFKENEDIMWWCPMQRFVIFPNEIHISHSMRQLMKKGTYHVTFNEAFDEVITNCSTSKDRYAQTGAWLGYDMIEAYTRMFNLHLAASVEVWNSDGNLVGGLYGINIGKNFFGESMFSIEPSASKLALIHLAQFLAPHGGIIDCQFETPHLRTMGGRHIPYDEYMNYLQQPEP